MVDRNSRPKKESASFSHHVVLRYNNSRLSPWSLAFHDLHWHRHNRGAVKTAPDKLSEGNRAWQINTQTEGARKTSRCK